MDFAQGICEKRGRCWCSDPLCLTVCRAGRSLSTREKANPSRPAPPRQAQIRQHLPRRFNHKFPQKGSPELRDHVRLSPLVPHAVWDRRHHAFHAKAVESVSSRLRVVPESEAARRVRAAGQTGKSEMALSQQVQFLLGNSAILPRPYQGKKDQFLRRQLTRRRERFPTEELHEFPEHFQRAALQPFGGLQFPKAFLQTLDAIGTASGKPDARVLDPHRPLLLPHLKKQEAPRKKSTGLS